IEAGRGSDALTGGGDADVFIFARGDGKDVIRDFSGAAGEGDVLRLQIPGLASFDALIALAIGQGGDLRLDFGRGDRIILAGLDSNDLTPGDIVFEGGTGADRLTGGANGDQIAGNRGNDLLRGGAGNDTLSGEEGNDQIFGEAGSDTLLGGDGSDSLSGDSGDDLLAGGTGNDTLRGGDGNDRLAGGTGTDAMTGNAGADTFIFASGDGNDSITDFMFGSGAPEDADLIILSVAGIMAFADLGSRASETATGVAFDLGNGDRLFLSGLRLSQISADDFVFI
ncbi:MAG: calcium-binding protein, partial [bacterium]|nr:calcium-binding protein [bacterium]